MGEEVDGGDGRGGAVRKQSMQFFVLRSGGRFPGHCFEHGAVVGLLRGKFR